MLIDSGINIVDAVWTGSIQGETISLTGTAQVRLISTNTFFLGC
jgi:hypothetical protein